MFFPDFIPKDDFFVPTMTMESSSFHFSKEKCVSICLTLLGQIDNYGWKKFCLDEQIIWILSPIKYAVSKSYLEKKLCENFLKVFCDWFFDGSPGESEGSKNSFMQEILEIMIIIIKEGISNYLYSVLSLSLSRMVLNPSFHIHMDTYISIIRLFSTILNQCGEINLSSMYSSVFPIFLSIHNMDREIINHYISIMKICGTNNNMLKEWGVFFMSILKSMIQHIFVINQNKPPILHYQNALLFYKSSIPIIYSLGIHSEAIGSLDRAICDFFSISNECFTYKIDLDSLCSVFHEILFVKTVNEEKIPYFLESLFNILQNCSKKDSSLWSMDLNNLILFHIISLKSDILFMTLSKLIIIPSFLNKLILLDHISENLVSNIPDSPNNFIFFNNLLSGIESINNDILMFPYENIKSSKELKRSFEEIWFCLIVSNPEILLDRMNSGCIDDQLILSLITTFPSFCFEFTQQFVSTTGFFNFIIEYTNKVKKNSSLLPPFLLFVHEYAEGTRLFDNNSDLRMLINNFCLDIIKSSEYDIIFKDLARAILFSVSTLKKHSFSAKMAQELCSNHSVHHFQHGNSIVSIVEISDTKQAIILRTKYGIVSYEVSLITSPTRVNQHIPILNGIQMDDEFTKYSHNMSFQSIKKDIKMLVNLGIVIPSNDNMLFPITENSDTFIKIFSTSKLYSSLFISIFDFNTKDGLFSQQPSSPFIKFLDDISGEMLVQTIKVDKTKITSKYPVPIGFHESFKYSFISHHLFSKSDADTVKSFMNTQPFHIVFHSNLINMKNSCFSAKRVVFVTNYSNELYSIQTNGYPFLILNPQNTRLFIDMLVCNYITQNDPKVLTKKYSHTSKKVNRQFIKSNPFGPLHYLNQKL